MTKSIHPDPATTPRSPGKVWLVGAGPGAADLLTVRAARLLARADIVFHDALVQTEMLALAPQAVHVPVGKREGRPSTSQRFINKRLIDAAQRHATVVRLKGGDPMLFGRAQEEIAELCAAGIEVEVVPGISAAFAAGADLMQSLTQRGVSRSVVFLTPRFGEGEQAHDWARAAVAADTLVVYMAGRAAGRIADGLMAAGLSASVPAVIVENASLPDAAVFASRLATLADAATRIGEGPALLLIGQVFEPVVARQESVGNTAAGNTVAGNGSAEVWHEGLRALG